MPDAQKEINLSDLSDPRAIPKEDRDELAARLGARERIQDPRAHYTKEGLFAAKLLEAQKTARDIEPTEKHYDGYMYAPVSQVVRELKLSLTQAGLVLQTAVEGFEEIETETSKGKPQWLTTVRLRFYLSDSETGYTRDYPFLGRGMNEKDKGVTHAIQSGKKAFLTSLLLVEITEDAPAAPPPQQESKRIPEARAINFRRSGEGDFIRSDSGEVVRSCMSDEVHGPGEAPMIRVPPDGTRWLCIHKDCGHVEAHDRDQEEGAPSDPVEKNEHPPGDGVANGLERLRSRYESILRRNNVDGWEEQAVIQATPEILDEKERWGESDYEKAIRVFSAGAKLKRCIDYMAEQEPADPGLVELLEELIEERELEGARWGRAKAAIDSNWQDAVIWWIEELDGWPDEPEEED